MEIRYDPNHLIQTGYFDCRACGAQFYEGGVHRDGCTNIPDFVFGPNQMMCFVPFGIRVEVQATLKAKGAILE